MADPGLTILRYGTRHERWHPEVAVPFPPLGVAESASILEALLAPADLHPVPIYVFP